jgi:hypothetical protein
MRAEIYLEAGVLWALDPAGRKRLWMAETESREPFQDAQPGEAAGIEHDMAVPKGRWRGEHASADDGSNSGGEEGVGWEIGEGKMRDE